MVCIIFYRVCSNYNYKHTSRVSSYCSSPSDRLARSRDTAMRVHTRQGLTSTRASTLIVRVHPTQSRGLIGLGTHHQIRPVQHQHRIMGIIVIRRMSPLFNFAQLMTHPLHALIPHPRVQRNHPVLVRIQGSILLK